MKATIARLVTAAVLTGGMLAIGSAAHAGVTAADPKPAAGAAISRVAVSGDVGTLRVPYTCFGYTGNFMPNTWIQRADWNFNGVVDECFGIAPDRTIWHAWPNSGGWKQMPNNGRADDTVDWWKSDDGRNIIAVWVNNIGAYCSIRNHGPGWGGWFRC